MVDSSEKLDKCDGTKHTHSMCRVRTSVLVSAHVSEHRFGLGHFTVDTFGNLQFHIFLLESLILKDLQETNFILPYETSSWEAFIFSCL